jgi:hypothetical protein
MKKLTTKTVQFLAIILLVAILFSCKKTVDYSNGCWECRTPSGGSFMLPESCDISRLDFYDKFKDGRGAAYDGVLFFTSLTQVDTSCIFKKR